jgi:hypothetical protein
MEKTQRPRHVLVSDDEDETTAKRRFFRRVRGRGGGEKDEWSLGLVFDGQHILIYIRIQYACVLRIVFVVFNSIGRSDLEFVVERVEPKCRVSRSPGSIWAGGERSALSLLRSGDFLMSFFFSCILHSLKQNVTDRARCID